MLMSFVQRLTLALFSISCILSGILQFPVVVIVDFPTAAVVDVVVVFIFN